MLTWISFMEYDLRNFRSRSIFSSLINTRFRWPTQYSVRVTCFALRSIECSRVVSVVLWGSNLNIVLVLLPGTWSHLCFAGVHECPPWRSIVGATVTVHQFFCILDFCHTYSLCRVELVVQFPARGSIQVLLCLFPGVLWLWRFLYSVSPYPVSSLPIYTFVVSRAFMADAASQVGDADSSRSPGLTSALQGSMNVHRGALLLVPQWLCISYFVFSICLGTFCVKLMLF